MDTFKYWLIANFEIAIALLSVIIGSIYIWGFIDNIELGIYGGGGVLFMLFVLVIPTQRGAVQFGKYILMLGGVILFIWGKKNLGWTSDYSESEAEMVSRFIRWFWIVFSIATVISVFLAVYTFINFDEVVSRRMSWRNSNVSLLEISILYTLDRFCNITVSIVVCTFGLILLFYMPNIPVKDKKEAVQVETTIELVKEIQETEIQSVVKVDMVVDSVIFEEEVKDTEILEDEMQVTEVEALNETDD